MSYRNPKLIPTVPRVELDRGLDREIGWLCATENAIDIHPHSITASARC
jgi:hypothetical protein